MNSLRLASLLSISGLLAGAFACGGISDPTRGGESVATVSGALTGTSVPAGARVALVWKKAAGGVEVGAEAPIVNGQFSMTLGTPSDAYFLSTEGNDYEELSGGSAAEPPSTATPEPAPAPSAGSGGAPTPTPGGKLATKTNVSGGITEPMKAAIAGFVVYVDANGNDKLDLEGDYASSPDTILGGNKELFLAFLKGGGQLDYEKLRDKSGILPAAGYNLAWEQGRWLPLTLVELKLTDKAKLPSSVCSGSGYGNGDAPVDQTAPMPAPADPDTASDAGAAATYPDPSDPNLHCSPDGRSFYYTDPNACPPPPPAPVGLCASDYGVATRGCAGSAGTSFVGDTPPAGWPCPVAIDGGAADAGASDAGPAPDAGAN